MASQNSRKDREGAEASSGQLLRDLWGFASPYGGYLLVGLGLVLLSSSTLLSFPFLVGQLLDVAMGKAHSLFPDIATIIFFMGGLVLLQVVLSYFRILTLNYASERVLSDLRKALYAHLLSLPKRFYDTARIGDLLSRLSADTTLVQQGFSTNLVEFIRQLAIISVGLILLFSLVPQLTLILLAIMPLIVLLGLFFGRWVRRISKERQTLQGEGETMAQQSLQLITTVKSFVAEAWEKERYAVAQDKVVRYGMRGVRYRAALVGLLIFVMLGGVVGVLGYGAFLVKNEQLSTGNLLSFMLYTVFIGGSMASLGDMYGQWQKILGAFSRLRKILQMPLENTLFPGETQASLEGNIVLKGVVFSYPSRKDVCVLKGVNLSVEQGKQVAIVGHSGGGKSTLISLLMRFYDPDEGEIYIGSHGLKTLSIHTLRQAISVVPQESILLGDSIRQNLLYGCPDAKESTLISALKKAYAMEFVSQLPQGLDTFIGDGGFTLSAGQRQRIAIARAILKDAPILILDEATSALDSSSEKLVQAALEELVKGRTTLIIAHRLATIRKVDRIYVLEKGCIAEAGAHDELYTHSKTYRQLIEDQLLL